MLHTLAISQPGLKGLCGQHQNQPHNFKLSPKLSRSQKTSLSMTPTPISGLPQVLVLWTDDKELSMYLEGLDLDSEW